MLKHNQHHQITLYNCSSGSYNSSTLKKNNMLYLINKIVATYYKQYYKLN